MRHVDDGTLHAWLDGEVSSPADREWVAQHLSTCAVCSARLEEERATLTQAEALLASVAPVADNSRPAFEALVARAADEHPASAEAPRWRPRGAGAWMLPVAWAASVVLAVTIGWSVRDRTIPEAPRPVASPTRPPEGAREPEAPQPAERIPEPSAPLPLPSPRPTQPPPRPGSDVAPSDRAPASAAPLAAPPPPLAVQPAEIPLVAPPLAASESAAARFATVAPVPEQAQTPPGFTGAGSGSGAGAIAGGFSAGGAAAAPPPVSAGRAGGGRGGRGGGGGRGRGGVGGGLGNGIGPGPAPARVEEAVQVDGMRVNAGQSSAASAWRGVARTEAAALSGMALYGIDGLAPVATMVNMDASMVRTVYRLATGEPVELTQQRTPPDVPQRRQPADVAQTNAGTTSVEAQAPVVDVQNARQLAAVDVQNTRPLAAPSWSTVRAGLQLTVTGGDPVALGARLRLD